MEVKYNVGSTDSGWNKNAAKRPSGDQGVCGVAELTGGEQVLDMAAASFADPFFAGVSPLPAFPAMSTPRLEFVIRN